MKLLITLLLVSTASVLAHPQMHLHDHDHEEDIEQVVILDE